MEIVTTSDPLFASLFLTVWEAVATQTLMIHQWIDSRMLGRPQSQTRWVGEVAIQPDDRGFHHPAPHRLPRLWTFVLYAVNQRLPYARPSPRATKEINAVVRRVKEVINERKNK